jgi:hypothetical protein
VTYWAGWAVSARPKRIHSSVSGPTKTRYADTTRIRIQAVSQAYPYRIRIRYGIRPYPGVSVLLSKTGTKFHARQIATISNFVFSFSAHVVQLLINANKNARYTKVKRIDKLQHSLYGLCM